MTELGCLCRVFSGNADAPANLLSELDSQTCYVPEVSTANGWKMCVEHNVTYLSDLFYAAF